MGDFDVDGAFVLEAGVDDAHDFGGGGLFIEQDGGGDGDFIVDAALGFEGFDFVVQEGIFFAVFAARGAGDDDDGGFFGIGAGDGVEDVEPADAVGDADQADAVEAGVGIGGEAGAGLVGHGDGLDGDFSSQAKVGRAKSPGTPKEWRTPR